MNTTTTKTEATKIITARAFKILINKAYRAENKVQWQIHGTPERVAAEEEAAPILARLDLYLVECDGEAHSNGFIDHCGLCMGAKWGRKVNRDLVK